MQYNTGATRIARTLLPPSDVVWSDVRYWRGGGGGRSGAAGEFRGGNGNWARAN